MIKMITRAQGGLIILRWGHQEAISRHKPRSSNDM